MCGATTAYPAKPNKLKASSRSVRVHLSSRQLDPTKNEYNFSPGSPGRIAKAAMTTPTRVLGNSTPKILARDVDCIATDWAKRGRPTVALGALEVLSLPPV